MTIISNVPVGNYYDKFNTSNPIASRLMKGFTQSFQELYARTRPDTILEVGCGEGYMLDMMADTPALFGLDVDLPILHDAQARVPRAHIIFADGHHLPYPDDAFDLVVACEVLEHVQEPAQVLHEMQRVARHHAIMSVPREPIWRILNMARGKYWRAWGNTPGHIQHWHSAAFVNLVQRHFDVVAIKYPLPWTMILAECR